MKKTGFYIIRDKFFEDMPDPYLKGNKAGNRPHYYCFEDTNTGIYWMIPLSSRIDKYKRIIKNFMQKLLVIPWKMCYIEYKKRESHRSGSTLQIITF